MSSDFAISLEPGWHETVFPPYFVAGALLSGFAMVIAIWHPHAALLRRRGLHQRQSSRGDGQDPAGHSFFTSYGYFSEQFITWISGETSDKYVYLNILIGFRQYAAITWITLCCVFIAPQLLWIKRLRRNEKVLFVVSVLVLAGMWMERYLLITTSLSRDFLPSSWGIFQPTIWDILTYLGSLGLFIVTFLLFCRFLPMISMSRNARPAAGRRGHEEGR